MMQNMCNNQLKNDLGMFNGSQLNQVNYTSTYNSAPVRSELTGGVYMNQSLPIPMAYSPGCSPQMVPMGMPTISPAPIDFSMGMPAVTPPLMNYDLPSVSPPPMAFVPSVPMMGYSVVPMQQGMTTTLVFPSASPENNMGYLLPEMALTPPLGSVSRSCSPVNVPMVEHVEEVARERLPSCGSNSSIDSSGSVISKKELVENCLRQIDEIFGSRVQTAGMRGPTVMRIKVKTRPALEKIVALLRTLEQNCNITAISCPKSTKKGKQHIRGFLAYIQTSSEHEIPQVQAVFDNFNRVHTIGADSPFKTLEVNPQKKK